MRFACSPDIAQEIVENVLSAIEDTDVYIDHVSVLSKDWKHCINLLSTILRRLHGKITLPLTH